MPCIPRAAPPGAWSARAKGGLDAMPRAGRCAWGGGRNKDVPFGKRLHSEVENHKSPSFGKSTICCAVFNSYVKLPEGEKTKLGLNHEISIKNRDS